MLASRNSKKQGGREVIYWSVAVVQIEQTLFIIHILFWWIFKQQPYKKHPQKSHTIKESHYSAHQCLPSGGSSGRKFFCLFSVVGNYDDLLVVVDIFRDKIETGMRVDKQRRRRCFFFFCVPPLRGVHVHVHVPPIFLLPDSVSPPLAPCRLCVFLGRRKEAARG